MRRSGSGSDSQRTVTFLLERAKRAAAIHERDRIYEALMCADAGSSASPLWSRRSTDASNGTDDNGDDDSDVPIDCTDRQFATVLPHRRSSTAGADDDDNGVDARK